MAAMFFMAAVGLTSCGDSGRTDSAASDEPTTYIDSLAYAYGQQIGARKYREFAALPSEQASRISKDDYIAGLRAALTADFNRQYLCDGMREGVATAINIDEWSHLGLPLNRQKVVDAYVKGYTDRNLTDEQIAEAEADYSRIFSRVQNLLLEKRRADRRDQQAFERKLRNDNIDAGKAFVACLKQQQPNLVETKSGLFYTIENAGNGPKPGPKSAVSIVYEIKSIDGNVIDSSHGEAVEVDVADMISGLSEGLQLMPVGSKAVLYIPSTLGFGSNTDGIEPGQMIVMTVQLNEIIR